MATAHLADFTATQDWTDLVATIGAAASVDVLLQNTSKSPVQIVAGGASEPTTSSGTILTQLESLQLNAANIWVRKLAGRDDQTLGYDGGDKISVATI